MSQHDESAQSGLTSDLQEYSALAPDAHVACCSNMSQNCSHHGSDQHQTRSVTVLVGSFAISFSVSASAVRRTSRLFQAACSRQWSTDESRPVSLPDETPLQFQLYIQFTETGFFNFGEDLWRTQSATTLLLNAYLLGERLEDTTYCTYIMRTLHGYWDDTPQSQGRRNFFLPSPADVDDVYNNTPPNSPLRKVLVDGFVAFVTSEAFAQQADGWHPELVSDLAAAALRIVDRSSGGDRAWFRGRCGRHCEDLRAGR